MDARIRLRLPSPNQQQFRPHKVLPMLAAMELAMERLRLLQAEVAVHTPMLGRLRVAPMLQPQDSALVITSAPFQLVRDVQPPAISP